MITEVKTHESMNCGKLVLAVTETDCCSGKHCAGVKLRFEYLPQKAKIAATACRVLGVFCSKMTNLKMLCDVQMQ